MRWKVRLPGAAIEGPEGRLFEGLLQPDDGGLRLRGGFVDFAPGAVEETIDFRIVKRPQLAHIGRR